MIDIEKTILLFQVFILVVSFQPQEAIFCNAMSIHRPTGTSVQSIRDCGDFSFNWDTHVLLPHLQGIGQGSWKESQKQEKQAAVTKQCLLPRMSLGSTWITMAGTACTRLVQDQANQNPAWLGNGILKSHFHLMIGY